ncbi:hypothetical protein DAI22_12g122550 [Oryza sativa Japonica Group]|nr:hypothetical protein DAI22_12g122550 [Oryza sativa Japonica Group]
MERAVCEHVSFWYCVLYLRWHCPCSNYNEVHNFTASTGFGLGFLLMLFLGGVLLMCKTPEFD